MVKVTIYTDGAASPNPGYGGWGCVILAGEIRKEFSGSEPNTTNNRMEMMAAVKSLQAITRPCEVLLYTDSRYLVDAFQKNWFKNWKRNGWKTAKGSPVVNQDLWELLLAEHERHQLTWEWVRGHGDNPENNRCDELAVDARLALELKLTGKVRSPKVTKVAGKAKKKRTNKKTGDAVAQAILDMNSEMEHLNEAQKKAAYKLFVAYWEDELA